MTPKGSVGWQWCNHNVYSLHVVSYTDWLCTDYLSLDCHNVIMTAIKMSQLIDKYMITMYICCILYHTDVLAIDNYVIWHGELYQSIDPIKMLLLGDKYNHNVNVHNIL